MTPTTLTTGRDDVRHRHGCTRAGWLLEHSHAVARVVIARCADCGAVELRVAVR